MRPGIAIVAGLLGLTFGAAQAGTVIESTTTDVRTKKPIDTTVISAQGQNLRLERRSALDPTDRALAIFANDRLYVIDDRAKAYRVMDRSAIETIEAARKAEAAKLGASDAPQGKRTQARTATRPTPKFTNTGKVQKVGEWSCRVWNATVQGRLVAQHCIVPVAKLGAAQDLGGALKSFSTFWREVASDYPGLQDTGGRLVDAFDRMKGVPVQTKIYYAGKPREIVTVKSVRQAPLGAPMFQVPQGYEQQNMVREAQAP